MKVLLLVNPFSSSVTARTRVVIRKALAGDHDVELVETSRRGHATRLAQSAAADGTDVVVCLGGDGTVNETANGLVGTSTALGVLPGGSTNVFARTIGLPNDPIEATADLIEAMDAGSIRRVGLGSVNGRYYCFHVGIGYDAALVEQVERRSGLKRWAGHPLFMYAGLTTWLKHYDTKRPHFTLSFDDGDGVPDGFFTIAANTNPYTFVGNRPFDIAPGTSFDNGLTVVTVRSMRVDRMLRIMAKALKGDGSLSADPSVHFRPDVDHVVVEAIDGRPFPYQVDGDFLGEITKLELRHVPDAMDLLLPVDYTG
ncbi:MAG: diacylglycerol kinase family lipid kinase [Acidimicrobiales bacterium]|nr:diacylglycerol kinase family lipid kinase [Acidimicrobiales bacterium]